MNYWSQGQPPEPGLYIRNVHSGRYAVWNGRSWHGYAGKGYQAEENALADTITNVPVTVEWKRIEEVNNE